MIHVKLSTTLRDRVRAYEPTTGLHLDYAGPFTVEDLAVRLGLPLSEIKIIMVNGRRAELPDTVSDGDRVAFFPAVGGG